MIGRWSLTLAMAATLAAGAAASPQTDAGARRPAAAAAAAKTCLQRLHRDDSDLPAPTRQARATLIANPGRIAVVVAEAGRAEPRRRAEIELGILRAAEWLQCVDPFGYQAIADYMRAHANDAVMADLRKASTAEASANTGPGGPPASAGASAAGAASNAGGFEASPAAPSPSFAASAAIVSPSH